MNSRIYLLLIVIAVFSLSACQPTGSTDITRPVSSAEMEAIEMEKSGAYFNAAQQYLELAVSVKGQQQSYFYLRAALAFWQINQLDEANDSLTKVDRQQLGKAQQLDAAILEADIALTQLQAELALSALSTFDLQDATQSQQIRALKLKANAYEITEHWLEKANAHIFLASLLPEDELQQNQIALWQALMVLTPEALELFNPGIAPAVDSGWFSLAFTIKSYQDNADTLAVALEDWQRNYPNHPADPAVYQQVLTSGVHLPDKLATIAIILPETGPYKSAANAIKQGLISAHFSANSDTQLHFFAVETDTVTGVSNVWQAYQQAIDLKANLVIGPLGKESVQLLADAKKLPIPVLALNRLANNVQKDNLFQFGLAPEDDAISAANYATNQGCQRAVVLAPNTNWGDRIASAFNEQWLSNGGILLNRNDYTESSSDFSTTISPLLNLHNSKQRSRQLSQAIATPIEFEPRRRQDIDFVFLIAKPLKARQLMPQLKFHRSGKLPIIATSHAYAGYEDSQQNIDLNGLIFNDIPWIFSETVLADPSYIALNNTKSGDFNRFIRLYALGTDAYRLIAQLNDMSRDTTVTSQGATGLLSIDAGGHVKRETLWATFNKGIIEPLPVVADDIIQ